MINKLKLLTIAFGIGLASTSNLTMASLELPDFDGQYQACIQQEMDRYCRITNQFPGCSVPSHIYFQIQANCIPH